MQPGVQLVLDRLRDANGEVQFDLQQLEELEKELRGQRDEATSAFDAAMQTRMVEVKKAEELLRLPAPVQRVSDTLHSLGQQCTTMSEELGTTDVPSDIGIVRRNLRQVEAEIRFYEDIESKAKELTDALDGNLGSIVWVYHKWIDLDDWRQRILRELRSAASDRTDELGSSKAQRQILTSLSSRLVGVQEVGSRILNEVWICMDHCLELGQFNRKRLTDAFAILGRMEERRLSVLKTHGIYLSNDLKLSSDLDTSFFDTCKDKIASGVTQRLEEQFEAVETHEDASDMDDRLTVGNSCLLNLEVVHSEVGSCFPPQIDALVVFATAQTSVIETEVSALCSHPDLSVSSRLQLVQWIESYNSELSKFPRVYPSPVLSKMSQSLLKVHLDQIQVQMHTWLGNIWRLEEEVKYDEGALLSNRPSDILNILKTQISIASEWLHGKAVAQVVLVCLDTLLEQLTQEQTRLKDQVEDLSLESLCLFINEADTLQAKSCELASEARQEGVAFAALVEDKSDEASTQIVQLAIRTCQLVSDKIFQEIETEILGVWFSSTWDQGHPVVETLVATLEDYLNDLEVWINSGFFFVRVLHACLNRTAEECTKRLLARKLPIVDPMEAAARVDSDLERLLSFFGQYLVRLRRTGVGCMDDLRHLFQTLEVMKTGLSDDVDGDDSSDVARHVRRLRLHRQSSQLPKTNKSAKSVVAAKKKLQAIATGAGNSARATGERMASVPRTRIRPAAFAAAIKRAAAAKKSESKKVESKVRVDLEEEDECEVHASGMTEFLGT